MRLDFGGERITPRFTTNTFEAEASVSLPSRKRMVSIAPASAESWRSRQLPISEIDLMSQRSQRLSYALTAAAPFCTSSFGGVTSGSDSANTVGSASFGKAWSRYATPRVTWKYTPWSSKGWASTSL